MRKALWVLILTLILALVVAGCTKSPPPRDTDTADVGDLAEETAAIVVEDQAIQDNGVTVARVDVDEAGWLVIHADVNGKPGPVAGHSRVEAGESKNVMVTVDQSLLTSTLYVMMHRDLGVQNRYEFPGMDVPMKKDDAVITSSFKLKGTIAQPAGSKFETSTGPLKELTLTAKQWEFTPNIIEVNKGDRVHITLSSADTPHGFSIAEYGIRETIQPGGNTVVEFVADKQGTFIFFCSVPCGEGHLGMKGKLIVK